MVLVGVLGSEIGDLVLCFHKWMIIIPSSTNPCTKKYLSAMFFARGLYVRFRRPEVPMCCRCKAARYRTFP